MTRAHKNQSDLTHLPSCVSSHSTLQFLASLHFLENTPFPYLGNYCIFCFCYWKCSLFHPLYICLLLLSLFFFLRFIWESEREQERGGTEGGGGRNSSRLRTECRAWPVAWSPNPEIRPKQRPRTRHLSDYPTQAPPYSTFRSQWKHHFLRRLSPFSLLLRHHWTIIYYHSPVCFPMTALDIGNAKQLFFKSTLALGGSTHQKE